MTKMAAKWLKSIPNLWLKRLKNHTLWAAQTYIAYIREYPPGDFLSRTRRVLLSTTGFKIMNIWIPFIFFSSEWGMRWRINKVTLITIKYDVVDGEDTSGKNYGRENLCQSGCKFVWCIKQIYIRQPQFPDPTTVPWQRAKLKLVF